MSACRPARHTATIRRAALSPARADRIDRPVDLRFLAVDGGMGTRRWSFHGIVRSGRGERGAGEWSVAALVPKAPLIHGHVRGAHAVHSTHSAAVERGRSRQADANDDANNAKAFHDIAPDLFT